MRPAFGIRANLAQFAHHLLQVLLVGCAIGAMRTALPALAEREFGVPAGSFLLLASFVVAFGFVKGALNFAAGRWSERIGRKAVLRLGWIAALPIPPLIYVAPNWGWIVAATVLLGFNQGMAWSMTQTVKLDLARADQRGLAIGLNEFAGYVGVALAGVITAYAATALGARLGLLLFSTAVTVAGLLLTHFWTKETLPWARAEAMGESPGRPEGPTTWQVFALMTWRDRRLAAVSQAGLVEKSVDALVWVFVPPYLVRQGVSLPNVGWIVGWYGVVWGTAQLVTGRLSDAIGRHRLNVAGMLICAAGVAAMPLGHGIGWWSAAMAMTGLGMAMLYPNLSAAVADIAAPVWRGSAIGIYRFWRDLGYGLGGLGMGLAAQMGGALEPAFWFVAVAMTLSGLVLWRCGEETHPRLAPQR